VANASSILLNGQFVYNETPSELFIGDGITVLSSLTPINGGGNQTLAEVLANGNSTGNFDLISPNEFAKLKVNDIKAELFNTDSLTYESIIGTYNGQSLLSYYDENSKGGSVAVSDLNATINHTDLINLDSPSVKKNSVEIATVNDIIQVNTSTIGAAINGATSATPNDTDLVMSVESSVAKKNTWTQIKAFLKTYFDTLYVTFNGTETLTNKRITARVSTTASSATPTPNADADDEYTVTALAAAATFGAPTGTPTEGQVLLVRIKDDGTARALLFNSIYRFSTDLAAPTTTVINKTLYMIFVYNNTDSKWDCINWINNF